MVTYGSPGAQLVHNDADTNSNGVKAVHRTAGQAEERGLLAALLIAFTAVNVRFEPETGPPPKIVAYSPPP